MIAVIDPATVADCRAIAQVHVQSWQHAYRDLLPAHYLAGLSVERREAWSQGIGGALWRCAWQRLQIPTSTAGA